MEAESSVPVISDPLIAGLLSGTPTIIPERDLVQLSKGSFRRFLCLPTTTESQAAKLWQSVFGTFTSATLSYPHRTAICNALCSFLESCRISQNPAIRERWTSESSWLDIFSAYLDRYDDGKAKPLKQVLKTLSKLVPANERGERKLPKEALSILLNGVLTAQPHQRLKPCMVTLDGFYCKGLVTAWDIARSIIDLKPASLSVWPERFETLCSVVQSEKSSSPSVQRDQAWQIFTVAVILNSLQSDAAAPAGELLADFYGILSDELDKQPRQTTGEQDRYEELDRVKLLWVDTLVEIIRGDHSNLELISLYVLPPLAERCRWAYKKLLDKLQLAASKAENGFEEEKISDILLYFKAYSVARHVGLIDDVAMTPSARSLTSGTAQLEDFLIHSNGEIRVAALSQLVVSRLTTQPFPTETLNILQRKLPFIHAEHDSRLRGEILSLLRKMIVRLRGSILYLMKTPNGSKLLLSHKAWLAYYCEFLKSELLPTCSFQRHISSLQQLSLLLEADSNPGPDPRSHAQDDPRSAGPTPSIALQDHHTGFIMRLFGLLTDAYDDVRILSWRILKSFPQTTLRKVIFNEYNADSPETLSDPSLECSAMLLRLSTSVFRTAARTRRADHSDGVGLFYDLAFTLAITEGADRPREIAEGLLEGLESVSAHESHMADVPFHGYLRALHYIVSHPRFSKLLLAPEQQDSWRKFHERVLALCESIWKQVTPILCIDSPEGQATDENDDDLGEGPKDALSSAWRSLRESSLVLHALLQNTTYAPGDGHLPLNDLKRIGTLCFSQLSELRHRGAFSTVSQTFTLCCQRAAKSSDEKVRLLPHEWHQVARGIIFEKATKLTRRSAGIPALVTGILLSDPDGPIFQIVLKDLQEIASVAPSRSSDGSLELPQVHALNCLKDIFINTRLGSSAEAFAMSSFRLSTTCLESDIWAIRNCGLMLFRAVMVRMSRYGGTDPRHISFERYPGLIEAVANLLGFDYEKMKTSESLDISEIESSGISEERVFPALELIGERLPPHPDNDLDFLIKIVLSQAGNAIWSVRERVARTFASLVMDSMKLDALFKMTSTGWTSENNVHGRLLCLRYTLLPTLKKEVKDRKHKSWLVIFQCVNICKHLIPSKSSPAVQGLAVEILNDVLEYTIREQILWKDGLSFFNNVDIEAQLQVVTVLEGLHEESKMNGLLDTMERDRASSLDASAVLYRAVGLNIMIRNILCQGSPCQIKSDPDSLIWQIPKLWSIFASDDAFCWPFAKLLDQLIKASGGNVEPVALTYMTMAMEQVRCRHPFLPGDQGIDLLITSDYQKRSVPVSRALANARLVHSAHLCRVYGFGPSSSQHGQSRSKLIRQIGFACQDETEFETRLSAAKALALLPIAKNDTDLLAFFLLYDLLNDDDEEIRLEAASTVSQHLRYLNVTRRAANLPYLQVPRSTMMPAAASALWREYLTLAYGNTTEFFELGLARILGQSLPNTPSLKPVADTIRSIQQASTDLFAAEKQNLYIDEMDEMNFWRQELLSAKNRSKSLVMALEKWLQEGKEALDMISMEQKDQQDVFNAFQNPDLAVLKARFSVIRELLE